MVLITADVPETVKARKEALGATWTIIILRGIQSLEGNTTGAINALEDENKVIREKLRSLAMKIYELEEGKR